MRRRRVLFAGFWRARRTRDCQSALCRRRTGWGWCELRAGAEKRVDGVSHERPQSFRYQRRPVDTRLQPRTRGGMTQDVGTRDGTFRGEIERISGLRDAVAFPNVTGRTMERIAQSKRALAGSLAIIVDEPPPPGVFADEAILPFSVLSCFVFVFLLFSLSPRPFVQSLLFFDMYKCPGSHTRSY